MKVNVYKLEVQVIDFDGIGEDSIRDVLENARYPNRCIAPSVKSSESREVEWSDDHPLNRSDTSEAAWRELFR